MACSYLIVDGQPVIACGRSRIHACIECQAPAGKLCDWKLGSGKTCDAPLCDTHAHDMGRNKDLCHRHMTRWLRHPANRQGLLAL